MQIRKHTRKNPNHGYDRGFKLLCPMVYL